MNGSRGRPISLLLWGMDASSRSRSRYSSTSAWPSVGLSKTVAKSRGWTRNSPSLRKYPHLCSPTRTFRMSWSEGKVSWSLELAVVRDKPA